MSSKPEKFTIKRTKTELGKNICIVLPMIEELTKRKLLPLCLIGIDMDKEGATDIWVATISDDDSTEKATQEIIKVLHNHFNPPTTNEQ